MVDICKDHVGGQLMQKRWPWAFQLDWKNNPDTQVALAQIIIRCHLRLEVMLQSRKMVVFILGPFYNQTL